MQFPTHERSAPGRAMPARGGSWLLGVAAAFLLAGCATVSSAAGQRGIVPQSRQERVALTLSTWTPPRGMRCVLEASPAVLPEPSALLDAEELVIALAQVRDALGGPSGSVLLSVGYGATGRPDRFHVVETSFTDPSLADDIAQLVDQRLYRLPPGDPFGVRLLVTLDEQPTVQVGRREVCFPRWAEAPVIGTLDEDPGAEDARRSLRRASVPALRVYMNAEGEVTDAYALGPMPSVATVGQLIAATRDAGYTEPAMLDRRPAGFWFTVRPAPRSTRTAHWDDYNLGSSYATRYRNCPAIYWDDYFGCDIRFASAYGWYGYGYPYAYYGYGYGGWWGVLPWWYFPVQPQQPTDPRQPGQPQQPSDSTGAPGDTIVAPPHAPPSRPFRPVITAGRPDEPAGGDAPARDLWRRTVAEERAKVEQESRATPNDARPRERNPRTLPFRTAPDAGEVSTGATSAVESRGASRVERGVIRAPQPEAARPVTSQPGERRLPVVHRPAGAARSTETRPAPERPAVTRPAPTERRLSPAPSPSAPRDRTNSARPGTSRPAQARPSSGRPAQSTPRPATVRSPSSSPASRPSTAQPAPSSSRPSSGAVRPSSSSGSQSSGGGKAIRPSSQP